MTAAHTVLRTATAEKHAQVDVAFARFELRERASYMEFLRAHARVVGVVEDALIDAPLGFPDFTSRSGFLESDLSVLGSAWPASVSLIGTFGPAALYGMLYVMEGSRLGGGVLANRVGLGMPSRYLSAVHAKGEWRTTLSAIDASALNQPTSWLDNMVDGARRTFDLYKNSAAIEDGKTV